MDHGHDVQRWMILTGLADYSFWVINRGDETAWSYRPSKGDDYGKIGAWQRQVG
jgi:hypothetical protein